MAALLSLPVQEENGTLVTRALDLSQEARHAYLRFAEWIEPQLGLHGELGHMADWAGKLAGAVVRIAGLLHMAEHADDSAPWGHSISEATFIRAVRIGEYAIPHAQAAHALMGADPTIEMPGTCCRLIAKKVDLLGGTSSGPKAGFASRGARAPLRLLIEHGSSGRSPRLTVPAQGVSRAQRTRSIPLRTIRTIRRIPSLSGDHGASSLILRIVRILRTAIRS
jgi:hypothetical protein